MYRFALRVLLSDWEGAEIWGVVFYEVATKVLGFNAKPTWVWRQMKTVMPHCPCTAGARVMVTMKKRVKDSCVNYTVSELEVVGS